MPSGHQIIKVLREELALQTRHCKLLEAQQRALLACDRPRFFGLREEQALMNSLLESRETVRQSILRCDDGAPASLSFLLESLPEPQRRVGNTLRSSIRETLDRVRTLTSQNERLIQNELDYIAFTLDLFVEAGRKADCSYGGSGKKAGLRMLLDQRA